MRQHPKKCDCFECAKDPYINYLNQKLNKVAYMGAAGRTDGFDRTDHVDRPATYYYDAILVANKPVTVYKGTSGTQVVRQFNKGEKIGKIYSHAVVGKDLWWNIDYVTGGQLGWIKHDPSLFDGSVAYQTSGGLNEEKKAEQRIKDQEELNALNPLKGISDTASGINKALSGFGDTIGMVGENLKYIIIFIAILAAVYLFLQFKKASA